MLDVRLPSRSLAKAGRLMRIFGGRFDPARART